MCHPAWGRALTTAQRLHDLARLRRVRDRIDREYARPLNLEALARDVDMAPGDLAREFRLAYGQVPYAYLMSRRGERGGIPRNLLRIARAAILFADHPAHGSGPRTVEEDLRATTARLVERELKRIAGDMSAELPPEASALIRSEVTRGYATLTDLSEQVARVSRPSATGSSSSTRS